jgi:hypothetical protein
MGSALSGLATIGMGQWEASAKGQAAAQDAAQEQRILSYNAQVAQEQGTREAGKVRSAGSQLIARQRVAYANSGVDTSSGTPLSVMADTRMLSELDAQTAANNAAREVWGYKMQVEQSKKNLQRTYEGLNRGVVGSILSGTGQILSGGMFGGG